MKGEKRMSINNVSNFYGKDYAAEFKDKWDKELAETKKYLPNKNVTIPIGQSKNDKTETLTGLEIEKSDVTANYADRKLKYSNDVEEAKAQEAFVKYGTDNGQKVKEENAEKMAKNYVENERHKEDVQGTQVFMDKKAYKAAEKERKEEYKDMYNQYREDGYTKKEAKRLANSQLPENEYISGKKTRKFVENNRAYFYDENGNFSSDKFKQKAVEYANINTNEDETLNYHLSLKERRSAAQQEGVSSNVIKHMAKKSNLDYEKDNTNLYRGLAIGGATAVGAAVGSMFHISASSSSIAGSSSSSSAIAGGTAGSATAGSSAGAIATASASAKINGALVGGATGLASGIGASGFLQDKGEMEKRVYAPGEPPVEQHKPKTSPEPDLISPKPVNDKPNKPAPEIEEEKEPCPRKEWEAEYCDHKVKKGQYWDAVILGKVKVNGKTPKGKVLVALRHAEKIKHGVTNFKLNTMPSTMRLYTDYSDLLENPAIMKKYPELKYLKDLDITVHCNGKVYSKPSKSTNYTKYKGNPMETNKYFEDCYTPEPVRINNK